MNALSTRTWYIIEHAGLDIKLCIGMTTDEIFKSLQDFFNQNLVDDSGPTADEIRIAAEEIADSLK